MFINFPVYGIICLSIFLRMVLILSVVLHLCRATHVQNENGSVVLLSASNPRQRNAIAKRLLTPSKEGSLGGAAKKVCYICIVTGINFLLLIVPTIRTVFIVHVPYLL